MNVKITYHDKNIMNNNLSILKILQGWLRWIRINVDQKENRPLIEEWNIRNVSMIKNVISQWETEERKTNIDIYQDSANQTSLLVT